LPARFLLRGHRDGAATNQQAPPAAGFLSKGKGDPDEDRKLWRGIISAENTAGKWRKRMNLIAQIEAEQIAALGKTIPDFKAGDTIRVGYKVTEGTRSRVQAYEGVCIGRKGGATIAASFTVRKISFGEGVERVFPLYSTNIDSIEVVRRGRVRRAKLYYLRDRRGKSARIAENTTYKAKAE
jgi:large subunit ribosomal protein L19